MLVSGLMGSRMNTHTHTHTHTPHFLHRSTFMWWLLSGNVAFLQLPHPTGCTQSLCPMVPSLDGPSNASQGRKNQVAESRGTTEDPAACGLFCSTWRLSDHRGGYQASKCEQGAGWHYPVQTQPQWGFQPRHDHRQAWLALTTSARKPLPVTVRRLFVIKYSHP